MHYGFSDNLLYISAGVHSGIHLNTLFNNTNFFNKFKVNMYVNNFNLIYYLYKQK